MLREGRGGKYQGQERQRHASHAGEATRWLAAAASAAILAACGGGTTGPTAGIPRSALLALARVDSAEPASPFCQFKNNVLSTCTITHSDSVHTLFASFTFAPHSIVSRNDTLLCDTCTIVVVVTIASGSYQIDVGPGTLVFNESGEPVATVAFGRYGDPSVYTQSPRYASATAFTQALELWHERSPDHWVQGRNSSHTGPTAITSALDGPGSYLVAAVK